MTEPSKYEEAAKEYFAHIEDSLIYPVNHEDLENAFLAGAEHASKEAHNAAIDKALTVMKIEWREDRHEIYNAIEKLKL